MICFVIIQIITGIKVHDGHTSVVNIHMANCSKRQTVCNMLR